MKPAPHLRFDDFVVDVAIKFLCFPFMFYLFIFFPFKEIKGNNGNTATNAITARLLTLPMMLPIKFHGNKR